MRRTTIITGLLAVALASLAMAPTAGAKARHPVTRAELFAAVHQQAEKSVATLEKMGGGAISFDRSRTSVGNYLPYGQFRKAAAFAIFGTNTANADTGTLWCVGNVEVGRTKHGRTRVAQELTCIG
jgi:hypothetical protein